MNREVRFEYSNTEPRESDLDPSIRVLNVPNGDNETAFVRTRENLIEKSKYTKIGHDSELSRQLEEIMNHGVDSSKKASLSIFDLDLNRQDRAELPNCVILEACQLLLQTREITKELKSRKEEIKQTVLNGVG